MTKDLDHPVVDRQHLSRERLNPVAPGNLRQLHEQCRGDPLALQLVGDQERHLGARAAATDVGGVGGDPRLLASLSDKGEPIGVVDVNSPVDHQSKFGLPSSGMRSVLDRPSRNARIASRSSARTGRTCAVEPSRSAMSASRSRGYPFTGDSAESGS